jgi:hypothetical protein
MGLVLADPSGFARVELCGSQSQEGAEFRPRDEGVGEQLATEMRERRVNLTVHFGDEEGAGGPYPLTQLGEPLDRCFVVSAGNAECNRRTGGDGRWTGLARAAGAAKENVVDALEPAARS